MKTVKKYLAVMMTIFMIAGVMPAAVYASPEEDDVAEEILVAEETAPVPELDEAAGPESVETVDDASEVEAEAVIPNEPSTLDAGESSEEAPGLTTGESSKAAADEIENEVPEEIVGAGVQVGEGVTATFDPNTDAVVFSSNGGTLWRDWISKSGFQTSHIKSICSNGKLYLPADSGFLFQELVNLTNLDTYYFDTSKVTNMQYMFYNCRSLTSLNVSTFDTSKVTTMFAMFASCQNLTSLDLGSFNTSNLKDIGVMFTNCKNLSTLVLTNFDLSKVTSVYAVDVFSNCSSLKLLKTPKQNSLAINLPVTLYNKSGTKYTNLPMAAQSVILAKDKQLATGTMIVGDCVTASFKSSTGALSLYSDEGTLWYGWKEVPGIDKSKIKSIGVSHGTVYLPSDSSSMFYGCSSLTNLDLSSFNTSNVTLMLFMFGGCSSLTNLDLSSFNTSNVTLMIGMFSGCSSLTNLDLSSFNTSNVTLMIDMFYGCSSLTNLDLSSFDTSKVGSFTMFSGCTNLEVLRTPKKHTKSGVTLPLTMYDTGGKKYDELPVLSKSIVLTRTTPKPTVSGFSDVQDPSHAYYKAIYWAANAGITKGYPDGTFGINRDCTRGEMMMFLWRYAGKKEPTPVSKSPFKDVPKTHTFYKAILWGSQKGITKGYSNGTFGVDRNVSRGECMMFLWRLKGKPAPTAVAKAPFPDVPKSHVFYNAVLWGYQKKITTGFTSGPLKGKFGVNENCSRGQIVTFLYRARSV